MSHRHPPGQALTELAIVMPVLLMIIIGLLAVGQILLAGYAVNQAARAAAHQAALTGGDRAAAEEAARRALADGVGTELGQSEVLVSCPRQPCRRYDPITVEVRYRTIYWVPVGLLAFSDELILRASATRAAERDQQ